MTDKSTSPPPDETLSAPLPKETGTIFRQLNPNVEQNLKERLGDICPDMGRFILEFVSDQIYARPGLDLKTRELITIASLVTLGHPQTQLEQHVRNALNAGCRREEIVETILQMAVYAGFPAALNGLYTAKKAFQKSNPTSDVR